MRSAQITVSAYFLPTQVLTKEVAEYFWGIFFLQPEASVNKVIVVRTLFLKNQRQVSRWSDCIGRPRRMFVNDFSKWGIQVSAPILLQQTLNGGWLDFHITNTIRYIYCQILSPSFFGTIFFSTYYAFIRDKVNQFDESAWRHGTWKFEMANQESLQ